MQCNFPICHNPHTTLSFTRKTKYKIYWSDDVEYFNTETLNRYKQTEQSVFSFDKQVCKELKYWSNGRETVQ